MKGLGAGDEGRRKYTSLRLGGLLVSIPDTDREERTAGESQAHSIPMPHSLLSSGSEMCSLSHLAPLAISSWWVTAGSCWGHRVSAHSGCFLRSEVFLSLTLRAGRQDSWVSRLPPVQGCPAGHRRVAELVSILCVGRAFSQGWEGSGIPGGTGVGALQPLLTSDLAWGRQHMPSLCARHGPVLASRLPS